MAFKYDKDVDVFRFLFNDSAVIEESEEEGSGVIVDYDAFGKIVGIEILDASDRLDLVNSLNALVAARAESAATYG